MWLWIGVGVGSFICVPLLVALAFARVVGALNRRVIELYEDRAPALSRRPSDVTRVGLSG